MTDFDRALAFYGPVMAALGLEPRFCDPARPWAGWQSTPDPRPLFIIGKPSDDQPHERGNGQMVAFLAASRTVVDAVHATALAHGGTSEGAPGARPEYHENYYGAYFRDPDGNKLCIACHSPPGVSGPRPSEHTSAMPAPTPDAIPRARLVVLPPDLWAFFESYCAAFDALDGEAVARLYAVPSGIASDSGYTHWPTVEPIRKNMIALCDLYRDNGYVSARFEPVAFMAQGEHFGIADIAWALHWREKEPSRFNTTYNLMRGDDGWRVLLCTAYSEEKLDARAGA